MGKGLCEKTTISSMKFRIRLTEHANFVRSDQVLVPLSFVESRIDAVYGLKVLETSNGNFIRRNSHDWPCEDGW